MEIKKILTVSIILLFLGIAVAPSINQTVVRASQENDLVEVNTQACGIKGYGDTTVKLTKQQYNDLEQYLVEFRAKLNQTTSKEEAVPIFKDAVVELDTYGLLPKGMSVEKGQKLVIGNEKPPHLINNASSYEELTNCSNLFCLFAGKVDFSIVANSFYTGVLLLIFVIAAHLPYYNYYGIFFLQLLQNFLLFLKNFSQYKIVTFFNLLSLLTFGKIDYGHAECSNGWVYTAGLLGIRESNGPLYGHVPIPIIVGIGGYTLTHYTGVIGFTGIRIIYEDGSSEFLGRALRVNIKNSPPLYPTELLIEQKPSDLVENDMWKHSQTESKVQLQAN